MDEVRASDAERDHAMERLREAAGEGRLTLEELADRIEAAQGAGTRGELARLTADLPVAPGAIAAVAPAKVRALGDIKRSGAWLVPEHSEYRTYLGHVSLDLREAQMSAPEVVIRARALFGDLDLLVPEGVTVEVRARARFGQLKLQAGGLAPPGAPRIVLEGGTTFGTIRVRQRRLWEKLARLTGLVR